MIKKYLLFFTVALFCANAFCKSAKHNYKKAFKEYKTVQSMAKHLLDNSADSNYIIGFFEYICRSKDNNNYVMALELLDCYIGEYVREIQIECVTRTEDRDYALKKVEDMLSEDNFKRPATGELLAEIKHALKNEVVLWSDFDKIKKKSEYAKAILWETYNKLEAYKVRFGQYPDSLLKITNDFLFLDPKGTNKDPWGSEYYYEIKGDKYILFSKGKDSKELTRDDIYLPLSNYELLNTN